MANTSVGAKLANALLNNRNDLVELISMIESKHIDTIVRDICSAFILEPDDKYLFRLLLSKYVKAKYPNTPIQYIPSKELLNSINMFISITDTDTVDFFGNEYCLLGKALQTLNPTVAINFISLAQNNSVMDNLDLIKITTRSLKDYNYYKKLNITYPSTIIIDETCFDNFSGKKILNFLKKSLIKNVIIISDITNNNMLDLAYHIKRMTKYHLKNIPIKLIKPENDFFTATESYYEYNSILSILTLEPSPDTLFNLFQDVSINTDIDMYPTYAEYGKLLYRIFGKSLAVEIFNSFISTDYDKNEDLSLISKYKNTIGTLKEINFVKIKSDLIFLLTCIENEFHIYFDSYIDFLALKNVFSDISERKPITDVSGNPLPIWIHSITEKMAYCYLSIINYPTDKYAWNTSSTLLRSAWYSVSDENMKKLFK